jgi:hypothetical protein
MTRRTTAHLFSSVNGVVESPNLFQFDAFGPEEGEMMGRAIAGVTDVVIGRTLWQEWVAIPGGRQRPVRRVHQSSAQARRDQHAER